MDIKRCFDILDLKKNATLDDLRQAYKDIVNVWHPDRFTHNPRLRKKAEARLKEINTAYEILHRVLPSRSISASAGAQPSGRSRDKTEAFVEAGTTMVLTTAYSFYKNVRRYVSSQLDSARSELNKEGDPKDGDKPAN